MCIILTNFPPYEIIEDITMSPGPKMLPGRRQQLRSPFMPLASITNFSASALVCAYASGN
jgi:hypothetical protein